MSRPRNEAEQTGLYPTTQKPDETERVLWNIRREIAGWNGNLCRNSHRRMYMLLSLFFFCPFLYSILRMAVSRDQISATMPVILQFLFLFPVVPWMTAENRCRRRKEMLEQLAAIHNIRTLPILLSLVEPNKEDNTLEGKAIENMFIRLLPSIQSEHRGLFNSAQRTQLYFWACGSNTTLAIRVLEALRHIAMLDALPYLQRLTSERNRKTDNPRIAELAQEIQAILENRVRQQAQPHELLRATTEPEHPAAELLRPAHAQGNTPSEELARASISPPAR